MGWKAELLLERGDKCSARSIRWIADGEILHLPGRYSLFLLLFFLYSIPSTHPLSFFLSFFFFSQLLSFFLCVLFFFCTLHINTCWKVLDTLLSVISWTEGSNSVWRPTHACLYCFCKSVINKAQDWLKVGMWFYYFILFFWSLTGIKYKEKGIKRHSW